ncbi:hypothetical protein [Flavobacterium sp. AG291]|uniref:hypothetical protein n=1 Tax=Flavobacterium sp. AG291 TaxID=2184000 RepID=UPI000E0C8D09|nr:hypothetical protein [Flavobacterium sp. AG291]RDI10247.1 hypothetical protein DEU42_10863 [Flavobacterium sp. AG291]
MIDNAKIWIPQKKHLQDHINHTRVIDLSTKLDLSTGLIDACPKRGKYFNMDVVLTCKSSFIRGSIHMLTNLLNGKERKNFNDLCFSSSNESISHLIKVFGLNKKTYITNLEFGLNIQLSKDPQELIDYNLLMYDLDPPNADEKFRGRGDMKVFHKTDYLLKIYNKSKQYRLQNHILRVEIKIISKRKLQKFGINRLEDLQKEDVIRKLYAFLMGEIQKLIVIDDFSEVDMTQEDQNELNLYTNPNYWKKLSRDRSYKVKTNRKARFKALITKYHLNSIHNDILTKVSEKFSQMMDCPQQSLKMVA